MYANVVEKNVSLSVISFFLLMNAEKQPSTPTACVLKNKNVPFVTHAAVEDLCKREGKMYNKFFIYIRRTYPPLYFHIYVCTCLPVQKKSEGDTERRR